MAESFEISCSNVHNVNILPNQSHSSFPNSYSLCHSNSNPQSIDSLCDPPKIIRCLQINLHHSRAASANAAQIALDLNVDVVLLQEPYAFSAPLPVIADTPQGFSAYHRLSADHAYGAAILVRDSFADSSCISPLHLDNFASCIDIKSRWGDFRFSSIYLRPSLVNSVDTMADCLKVFSSKSSIVCSDTNAKNIIWNSNCTDQKGLDVEHLLFCHGLSVANKPRDELNFLPTGTSFMDVTLVGEEINILKWLFLPFPSLSDHPFIYFEIISKPKKFFRVPPSNFISLPKLDSMSKCLFLDSLRETLTPFQSLPFNIPIQPIEIERRVIFLAESIVRCAKRARLRSVKSLPPRSMPWWSSELCALRTKARTAYRHWSISKSANAHADFKNCKAVYQRALRRAKVRSWADFSKRISFADTFKEFASLEGRKKTVSLPDTMRFDDVLLTDPLSIIERCSTHFFPTIQPLTSDQRKIEDYILSLIRNEPLSTCPPISDWELDSALLSLRVKSSSGVDGIPSSLFIFSLPVIRTYLLNIYNACLNSCFFPSQWKISRVTIIGKPNKSSYDTINSFRPISVGSSLSKLLEKIILGRLIWLSNQQKWISEEQHGFRQGFSTETAVHSLTSVVEEGFSKRMFTVAAFLDISSCLRYCLAPCYS